MLIRMIMSIPMIIRTRTIMGIPMATGIRTATVIRMDMATPTRPSISGAPLRSE